MSVRVLDTGQYHLLEIEDEEYIRFSSDQWLVSTHAGWHLVHDGNLLISSSAHLDAEFQKFLSQEKATD
jgi:hypothetical protein